MLTYTGLVALHRALASRRVLSIYIDGSASDPALQRSWRLQLDHGLADVRRWLEDSSHDEREEFERCVRRLDAAIAPFAAGIGAPGWAVFITADQVHDAQQLPAPAPTLVVWSTGPCVAPYIHALKEGRPVVVVLADARRASIYRYLLGELDRVDVMRAYHTVDHPEHMGTPPQRGFHTGTRGTAGHDAAQRSLLRGRDRMIVDTVDRVRELAGVDGCILIGGIKRISARLTHSLESVAPSRVAQLGSLDVHASEALRARFGRPGVSTVKGGASRIMCRHRGRENGISQRW